MKKKNPVLLIVGILLLIAGTIFCFRFFQPDVENFLETDTGRYYAYSLLTAFIGVIFTIAGLVKLFGKGKELSQKEKLLRVTQAGLLAALCYIGFAFFKIDIPVGTSSTAFHLGNVFCVLAALLLGGFWGGLAGAVGMTIGDLTTIYVTSAPKTFILKFCIGLITGLIAHRIARIDKSTDKAYVFRWSVIAAIGGMLFNVIFDPLVGYFYKRLILGKPAAEVTLAWNITTTSVNAVLSVIVAVAVYMALRPALKKANLSISAEK